ncbi:MAG: gliding motility-associated C-terminal domain-containing protein, partial [Chitinophagaceae bacterium]
HFFSGTVNAQGIFTGINNTVINLPCTQPCTDLNFQVPHLKSDDDYQVVTIPYTPYPYATATGNELSGLYIDDVYSSSIPLPFPLCFYGSVYNEVIVGSNGLLTFDIANANCINAYTINPPIPYNLGVICNLNSTYYPKASIMGAYSDLDPSINTGFPNRKIEWRIEGTAPFRRFVASWYRIGVFGNNSCSQNSPSTFQIVINEATAVIEVFFERLTCLDASNNGRAILGIQDFSRTKAVAAPGKNAQIWTAFNEGYRFVPSGAISRFVRSELYLLNGATPIATATASTPTPGKVDISFPNICLTTASQQYLVKTIYSSCIDPTQFVIIDDTITINKLLIPATIKASPTTCAGVNNGSVQINPTGVAPYTFSLDGGTPIAGAAPYTFFNVSPGLHTVMAIDLNGCTTDILQVNVTNGPPLATTAAKTNVLCNGSATGTITVTQPGVGTAPFEYSLNGTTWQISNVFNGLAAGIYTVFFREGNGCQGSLSITVAEPIVLSASSSFTPVVCNGQSNGIITINSAGGVTPYQYSIDGGTTWQASNIFNVSANTYTITIRDANNCTTTQSVTVTQPAALTASSVNSPASCDGGNDGIINVSAAGGNAVYEYSIDNGTTWQASNILNTGPGIFTILVRDSKGCTFSFSTTVALGNNFTMTPQTDEVICEGASTQLELISKATQFNWSPATGLSDATIPNPVANPTVTTQYTVTATLGRCSADDIVIVNVNAAPIPDAGADGFICYGQTYQLQANGGTQYQWTPDTYLNNATIANPVTAAIRDITYTLSILSDANGCPSTITDKVFVDVTPAIKVTTFPNDTIGYSGDKIQLLAIPNDSDVINYVWTPSKGLNDPRIPNPVVTLGANGDVTQYQVITSTIAGCKGEGFITVRVYKGPEIYLPTAFTPNGDGRNDRFLPVPVGIKSLNYFRVFNRWGQLVFQTKTLHDGWDGKLNGGQQALGVYVWMIEAVTNQDKVITKKGTVTLLR